jgi:hypothetical protein
VQDAARARFAAWGLWHDDETPKPEAVRPVAWLLDHAPELRVRALAGPTLEADVLAAVLFGLPVGGLLRGGLDGRPGRGAPDPRAPGATPRAGGPPQAARSAGVTVRDVSRALHVSYAAAHESADRLLRRGALTRERHGRRQVLRPSAATAGLLCEAGCCRG